jgi:predicted nucleic acid-binding protein
LNVYLDSSTIVRWWLKEPLPLQPWGSWERASFSALAAVEIRRTLRRLQSEGALTEADLSLMLAGQAEFEDVCRVVPIDWPIVELAGGPMPRPVRTLDAIHLATAMLLREVEPGLVFATHDRQQAFAARELGFEVAGYAFDP